MQLSVRVGFCASFTMVALAIFPSLAQARTPQVPRPIQQHMQDRDYDAAVEAIQRQLKTKEGPLDYLTYLLGRAHHLQHRYDEAVAVFEGMVKQFPDSPWTRRARFAQAVSLARKGDFRKAELIYRKEAEYLFSLDRKEEVSSIYLEFADAYFKPDDVEKKPDYKKALEFYGQSLTVGPKTPTRRRVELNMARCQQELGQHDQAVKSYREFIRAEVGDALEIEARYRLGQSLLAKNNLTEARRTWKDLVDLHGKSDSPRLAEARFELSKTYRIPQPQNDEQLNLGVASLQAFLAVHPDHKLASLANLRIVESYHHRGRHEDAVKACRKFLGDERYADRDEIPRARVLLGRSLLLQRKFDDALQVYREYLTKHPTDRAWSDVQRAIIDAEYLEAESLWTDEKYAEAREKWEAFLARHPLDGRNRRILFLFGQMRAQEKKWEEALRDWRRLVSKYPKTEEASQAQYQIARTLEEQLGRLEEALQEYRKVTWGRQVAAAKARVARLIAKSLSIATEHVFRSGQTPQIKVVTRNLENVQVRVYQVDLETYFRKMHLASGVERLDISLIDPDASFDFEVPEYQKYQKLENEIDVPLPKAANGAQPGSGVLAVTVSSKTQEATSLVVQSDMDVIVKSSRDELFVFAQNMRTGKPWPQAKLLISDGSQVFAEGVTGDDGVFRGELEKLKSAQDIRVFAISDGHTASSVVGLNGLGVAQGLSARGYLYSDRPAYRPGQIVHVRGVVRHVAGDAYIVCEGAKYLLEVHDNRNRLVHHADVTLSSMGTLHGNFQLPEGSPQGKYRLSLHDQAGKEHYQGGFIVSDYQPQTMRLEVDTPRKVYYRGEDIEGTIRASFYYGAPVVGREVRYRLENGRVYTAKTDDRGEIRFSFSTREFRESQPLTLRVEMPSQGLQGGAVFQLATMGFQLQASVSRPVFLQGESFELSVKATDAEGEPAARPLELRVFRRTVVNRKVGEVEVETHELATDDKGMARKTLKLEQGGKYVLRVQGVDRFKNPITSETTVNVSDDKDRVRLRILADQHTFRVGDTAAVKVHWREKPGLALVTYQGARILDYRLVPLKPGVNTLQIPLTPRLAPNFELSISVMTDPSDEADAGGDEAPAIRFHAASSPFTVQRELLVKLDLRSAVPNRKEIRPGDDVEVVVTTTDPQGNPVAAEVGLAMIEKSLVDRFGANQQPIQDFFRGANRQSAVRTQSSIDFRYRPKTRNIDRLLLAEADRLEVVADESRRLVELAESAALAGEAGATRWSELGRRRIVTGADNGAVAAVPNGGQVMLGDIAVERLQNNDQQLGANGFAGRLNPAAQQQLSLQIRQQQAVDFDADGNGEALYSFFSPLGRPVMRAQSPDVARAYTINGPQKWGFKAGDVSILQKDGIWLNFNASGLPGGELKKALDQFASQDAMVLASWRPQETAYWNPAVVTDDSGRAVVKFSIPERSTAWLLQAKGVTVETLAGEQSEDLVVKKALFGELKLPTALVDGDQADVGVSVHNQLLDEGEINLTLRVKIGNKTTSVEKTIQVEKKGIQRLTIPQVFKLPAESRESSSPSTAVEFELIVASGDQRDVARRAVPLLPFGMPVFALAGGTARGDVSAVVEAPGKMPLTAARLQILVGPSIEGSLLQAVLGTPTWCQAERSRIASGVDTATSDLMAALALQKLITASRDAKVPQAETLDDRIRSSISLLISLQNEDGGWNWAGRQQASDRYITSRAVWALSLARKAGYRVSDNEYNRSINFVRSQVAKAAVADYETKAVLLQALASAGKGDFTLANQLYRNRPSLSSAGLAHLALAFAEMDRQQTAGELLNLLGKRDLTKATAAGLSWNQSASELRALYALGLDKVAPTDGRLAKQVEWLMSHRTGHRWSPDKATGPAMLAVCRWYARSRFQSEKYELTVYVNDVEAKKLSIDKDTRTRLIDVEPSFLKGDKQRVRFEINGRGQFTYQCVLGGFVAGDQLRGTNPRWEVTRHVEPAPMEVDGREIPRGFDVLVGSYSSFRNPLEQLPVGRRGQVELSIRRHRDPSTRPDRELEYLVVTEPLPAGVTVVEDSIRGGFDRYEIVPGAIVFYVGSRRRIEPIRFDVHGYLPGEYRTSPSLVRNAFAPDEIAVAKPRKFEILPLGALSADEYRLTPRELFELGKLHFAKGDFQRTAEHLRPLVEKWNLKGDVYRESVRMLLDVHLKQGPSNEVVRYFEIILEKYPDLEIPFPKLLQVGDAYHEIGEYERSYLVFRAAVEASFLKEVQVAGFLADQDKFLRSVDVTGELLREYPPEPYVAAAQYALAQRVYAKAPEAASDAELREKELTRVDLIREAGLMLDGFLTANPEDPAADEASFSLANSLLDLELYEQTIKRCGRFAERYPDSQFLDSYWYIIGYCHYARGEHKAALEMCNKVAESKRRDKATGREEDSQNKWRAIYILGQIRHSLGQAEKAIEEYSRVKERFADARQAIEYFVRKHISLPEISAFQPGENVTVPLGFRNVADCKATVYRIDLMKFSLLRRTLGGITKINLSGIRPYHDANVQLGDGKDYRDRTHNLSLPLKEEGAYLIVCRAENMYATGLALVSPLKLEIQENTSSGRVRATVRNEVSGRYEHDVHVKVIGSANSDFVSGETDLRGIFVADGIRGNSMVIAKADQGYAFYRGSRFLGPAEQGQAQQAGQAPAPADDAVQVEATGKGELLKGLKEGNSYIQRKQNQNLDRYFKNSIDAGIPSNFGGGLFK